MGIKTPILLSDLSPYFRCSSLKETKNGFSDTVYIVDDKYILKIFENSNIEVIKEEVKLLKLCQDLPVARVYKEIFFLKEKPSLIYLKAKGESLSFASDDSINQIVDFLKQFHKKTKNKKTKNKNFFEKENISKLIKKTEVEKFEEIFNSLDINLNNDGIIHADLFIDNTVFYENKLTAVYDFTKSSNGDFIFDLAIVALSWCNNKKQKEMLFNRYNCDIKIEEFNKYIEYAALCFSIFRYFDKRDYNELLYKAKELV